MAIHLKNVSKEQADDAIFALYLFCSHYHSGQNSRGYKLLSLLSTKYRPHLPDSAETAIAGNRHGKKADILPIKQYAHWSARMRKRSRNSSWDEWVSAREIYRQLKRKYAESL